MQLLDLMHKHCLLLSKTRKHSLWAKEMKELTLKEDKTEDKEDKTEKGTYMCVYIFLHITKKKKKLNHSSYRCRPCNRIQTIQ